MIRTTCTTIIRIQLLVILLYHLCQSSECKSHVRTLRVKGASSSSTNTDKQIPQQQQQQRKPQATKGGARIEVPPASHDKALNENPKKEEFASPDVTILSPASVDTAASSSSKATTTTTTTTTSNSATASSNDARPATPVSKATKSHKSSSSSTSSSYSAAKKSLDHSKEAYHKISSSSHQKQQQQQQKKSYQQEEAQKLTSNSDPENMIVLYAETKPPTKAPTPSPTEQQRVEKEHVQETNDKQLLTKPARVERKFRNRPQDHDDEKKPMLEEQQLHAHQVDIDQELLQASIELSPFSVLFDIQQQAPDAIHYVDAVRVTRECMRPFMFYKFDDALEYFALTSHKAGLTSQGPRIDFVAHVKFIDGAAALSDETIMEQIQKAFTEDSTFVEHYLKHLQELDSSNPFHETERIRFHSIYQMQDSLVDSRVDVNKSKMNPASIIGAFAGAAIMLGISGLIIHHGSKNLASEDGTAKGYAEYAAALDPTSSSSTTSDVVSSSAPFLINKKKDLHPFLISKAKESTLLLNWLPRYWQLEGPNEKAEEDDQDDDEDPELCELSMSESTHSSGTCDTDASIQSFKRERSHSF
ncbi:unknown protein [Seminavis robusta]|uniref:Uncharacterized protein n=1 Tax=Seminavis robusta TaxID=568900 RepID=A0A9N8ETF5_9STRA|nr:unknown protein [Seminavis robusta]|eukprot:Sro1637_g287680.1 n/a (587) ;mRNA; r:22019-23968